MPAHTPPVMALRIDTYAWHGSFARHGLKSSLHTPVLSTIQSPHHLKVNHGKSESTVDFEFNSPFNACKDRPPTLGFQTVTMDGITTELTAITGQQTSF